MLYKCFILAICHCAVKDLFFSKRKKLHLNTMMRHSSKCLSMNSLLLYHNKVWLITFVSCLYEIAFALTI